MRSTALALFALFVALAVVACTRETPRPAPPPVVAPRPTVVAAPPPPKACLLDGSAALVRVLPGETTHTPMGLDVTFVGSMHDDYDDGRFDDIVEIRFTHGGATETRLVSLYAPATVEELFDDVCWELTWGSGRELRLTFYPRLAGEHP